MPDALEEARRSSNVESEKDITSSDHHSEDRDDGNDVESHDVRQYEHGSQAHQSNVNEPTESLLIVICIATNLFQSVIDGTADPADTTTAQRAYQAPCSTSC